MIGYLYTFGTYENLKVVGVKISIFSLSTLITTLNWVIQGFNKVTDYIFHNHSVKKVKHFMIEKLQTTLNVNVVSC